MSKSIITLPFFKNETQNKFSEENYLVNGGKISIIVEGLLDGAKIKFYIKYLDDSNYVPYVSGENSVLQLTEGKEFEINEEIPCFIKIELFDVSLNTNVTVTGYYIDKFSDYGIL